MSCTFTQKSDNRKNATQNYQKNHYREMISFKKLITKNESENKWSQTTNLQQK
jgi:hypothetical protein